MALVRQKGLSAVGFCWGQLQKGQILLVVILVIVVALTVGLSLISRSITNLRTSTEEAESQEALSAAEAGIERSIQNNVAISSVSLNNGSKYSTQVVSIDGGSNILLNGGNVVQEDEGIDVWFEVRDVNGEPTGSFTAPSNPVLYWGTTSSTCDGSDAPAAIQVIAVTTTNAAPPVTKTYRYAYDPCSATRENNFTQTESGIYSMTVNGINYKFGNKTPGGDLASEIIAAGDNVIFMRVVPIYKDAVIAISNDNQLPLQGYQISSTGTSGQAKRMIRVFKGWPQTYLPYLSYGLFVPED